MSTAAVEAVWTSSAFAGLFIQFTLTVAAWRDRQAVLKSGFNSYRILYADSVVVIGLLLMGVHGAFVTLGVRALQAPNAPLPWSASVLIPIGLFMASSFLLVLVGLTEVYVRRRIIG